MNDFDPDLDELVSAYVDGEATADEVARVESDPDLGARAARYRSLSTRLGDVTPPSDDIRDAQLARARREHASGVGSLAAARAHRRPSARSWRIASIAAAIAVVFIAIPLLFGGGGDDAELAGGDGGSDTVGDSAESTEMLDKAPDTGAQSQPALPAEGTADEALAAAPDGDAVDGTGDDGASSDGGDDGSADDGADSAPGADATALESAYARVAEEAGIELEPQDDFDAEALPPTCADDLGVVVLTGRLDGDQIVAVIRIDETVGVYRVADCELVADLPAP